MLTSKIHYRDLIILQRIFAPSCINIAVFDPNQDLKICDADDVRLLNIPLESPEEDLLMIDLSDFYVGTHRQEDVITLSYINNPDGSIRWLFPSKETSASFLQLFNPGTIKSRFLFNLTKIVWNLNLGSRLVSGTIKLQLSLFLKIKEIYNLNDKESISIFTGTKGAAQKAVIEIHTNNQSKEFIKISFSDESKKLINNEIDMITNLSKYDLTTLSLPVVTGKVNGCYKLSNIKPQITVSHDRITAIHMRAIAELYALSHERKQVVETAAWHTIQTNMEWLKREIVFSRTNHVEGSIRLIQLLRKLYNQLPIDESVAVSVSHGDFTPWNMYTDENRLFVYDWELARNGIPMLFDLYHFSFQTVILQQHKDFNAVNEAINKWMKQPLAKQLVSKYHINTELHFKIYLLFTISYYLRQYLSEKELPIQSKWMVEAWTDALEKYSVIDNSTTTL
jgi:hypothetical protein